jgi:hypothetical protein
LFALHFQHHRHWPAQGLNKDAEPTPQSARLPSLRQGYPPIHDVTRHDHDKFARLTILRGLVNALPNLVLRRVDSRKKDRLADT